MSVPKTSKAVADDPLETASIILRSSHVALLRKVAGSRRLLRSGSGYVSVSEIVREAIDLAAAGLTAELERARATISSDAAS